MYVYISNPDMSGVSPQRDQGGEVINSREASVIAKVIRERLHQLLPRLHNKLNVTIWFLFAFFSGSDVTGLKHDLMYCMVIRIRTVVIKPFRGGNSPKECAECHSSASASFSMSKSKSTSL